MNFNINETPHKLANFFTYLEAKNVVLSENEKNSLKSIFDQADEDKSGQLETAKEKGRFWMSIKYALENINSENSQKVGDMFFDFWAELFQADMKKNKEAKEKKNNENK